MHCEKRGESANPQSDSEFLMDAGNGQMAFGSIFSNVFKRQPKGALERCFRRGEVSRAEMVEQWQRPWLFARVFLVLLLTLVVLNVMMNMGFAMYTFAPMLFLGCCVVPVTLLFFFWEMDVPSNVSFFEVMGLLLLGGVCALLIGGWLNDALHAPAWAAAFTEEPAKLLLVIAFMGIRRKKFYILDGVVIGASVAAGFALMESTGYVIRFSTYAGGGASLLSFSDTTWHMIVMRNVAALGSHILFTAPFAGALCWLAEPRALCADSFRNRRFWAVLASGVLLHAMNNSDVPDVALITVSDGIYGTFQLLTLGMLARTVIAWLVMAVVLRAGLRQVLQVQTGLTRFVGEAERARPAGCLTTASLYGMEGLYAGQRFALKANERLVIGRDPARCNLLFPDGTPGISRVHCTLHLQDGRLSLTDEGSSCGTFLGNGKQLKPHEAVLMNGGDRFWLSKEHAQKFGVGA